MRSLGKMSCFWFKLETSTIIKNNTSDKINLLIKSSNVNGSGSWHNGRVVGQGLNLSSGNTCQNYILKDHNVEYLNLIIHLMESVLTLLATQLTLTYEYMAV